MAIFILPSGCKFLNARYGLDYLVVLAHLFQANVLGLLGCCYLVNKARQNYIGHLSEPRDLTKQRADNQDYCEQIAQSPVTIKPPICDIMGGVL